MIPKCKNHSRWWSRWYSIIKLLRMLTANKCLKQFTYCIFIYFDQTLYEYLVYCVTWIHSVDIKLEFLLHQISTTIKE